MKLFLIHDPRQSKVGYQKIRVVFWGSEQEVLRLQISMDDTMVVKVCDGREGRSNEFCGI